MFDVEDAQGVLVAVFHPLYALFLAVHLVFRLHQGLRYYNALRGRFGIKNFEKVELFAECGNIAAARAVRW